MRPRIHEAAFDLEAVYRQHADAIYTLAWRITGSRADAEDVLQDLFIGLPRALASYREQGRLESWLKRSAARLALMRLRAARRRSEVSLQDAGESPLSRESHPMAAISSTSRSTNTTRSGSGRDWMARSEVRFLVPADTSGPAFVLPVR